MKNELQLKPSYWASVSGGKDSFYMLNLILHNLDIYPLDGVVHFELEIDYPFIINVVDIMEKRCKENGVRFVRIKPRTSWETLYNKYGYPSRVVRWCNDKYKLDALNQLREFLKTRGCRVVSYIGYCVDEVDRYSKRNNDEIYPLVDFGIEEQTILEWARTFPAYNGFYKINRRCGCMGCPMSHYIEYAYLLKYYPETYARIISKMKETERVVTLKNGRPFSLIQSNPKYNTEYLDHIVRTKYMKRLEEIENGR